MPRPMTEADRTERAQLLTGEGYWLIDTHRPVPVPGVPRPGAARRIPTKPTLLQQAHRAAAALFTRLTTWRT